MTADGRSCEVASSQRQRRRRRTGERAARESRFGQRNASSSGGGHSDAIEHRPREAHGRARCAETDRRVADRHVVDPDRALRASCDHRGTIAEAGVLQQEFEVGAESAQGERPAELDTVHCQSRGRCAGIPRRVDRKARRRQLEITQLSGQIAPAGDSARDSKGVGRGLDSEPFGGQDVIPAHTEPQVDCGRAVLGYNRRETHIRRRVRAAIV